MCGNFFNSINKFLSYKVGEKHQKKKNIQSNFEYKFLNQLNKNCLNMILESVHNKLQKINVGRGCVQNVDQQNFYTMYRTKICNPD